MLETFDSTLAYYCSPYDLKQGKIVRSSYSIEAKAWGLVTDAAESGRHRTPERDIRR
jgi:hypothetical protein